nr:ATP synthase F0 subunit 8 [Hoplodactylus duvaucelii]UNQ32592.1 ATP synthase F0 subunit 8 [Hoplodactylus duvaucelii]UNQ32852.1 ATP synthase F0 subunit 8 [Hoplodactylus duvaucelii]
MPQLNPAPWLLTLIMSWTFLTIFLTPKLLTTNFPNSPEPQLEMQTNSPWIWPWS